MTEEENLDRPRGEQDRILYGWAEIAAITPWRHKVKTFYQRFSADMIDRGFVQKEVFRSGTQRTPIIWTWESLVKAYFAWRTIRKQTKKRRKQREKNASGTDE